MVQANIKNFQRILILALPSLICLIAIQVGFTVFTRKGLTNYNQARREAILTGQQINLPNTFLNNLQNYAQSSSGFTSS